MTVEKEITCVVCPIGCKIIVTNEEMNRGVIKGNKCKKGIEYTRNEVLNPRRMLTSSIRVYGGEWPLVSVKSSKPVPKDKIFTILTALHKMVIQAPVYSQQCLMKNVLNIGIDIIATKTVRSLKNEKIRGQKI